MPALSLLLALAPVPVQLPLTQGPPPARDYAVLVNGNNPTRELTGLDLRRILRAERREWSDGERVEVLLPRSGTPEKQVLLDEVYAMSDLQLKRYWTRMIYENKLVSAPRSVPSGLVAQRMLERLRGAVTVAAEEDLAAARDTPAVAVDGKLPGQAGYPLRLRFEPVTRAGRRVRDGRPAEATASLSLAALAEDPAQSEILSRLQALEEQALQPAPRFGGLPPINLMFFGHLEAEYEEERSEGSSSTGTVFSLEVLDILATTALSEQFSVLAETVIEGQDENDFELEVERLLLKWRHSDALSIELGRFLTSIGHWNTKYHHGEWLQTSIDRPDVLSFEDDGGMLPMHTVGLSMKGAFHGSAGSIDYAVELSNGRAPVADQTQVKEDANDQKALNLALGIEPASIPGLRFGGGVYLDDIPRNSDPAEGVLHPSLEEKIVNGYVVYERGGWEAMAEIFDIEHDDGASTVDSDGWYAQLGYNAGLWTPYVRIDQAHRDDQDLYWEEAEDTHATAFGVRCDVNEWAALTLQYEHAKIDMPPGDPNETTRTIVLQATFVF